MGIILEELKKDIERGEKLNALEKFQNLILTGLSLQTDFFKHAALFGGTSLRIFHDLPRFSEDLDFTLDFPDTDFSLISYKEPMSRFLASVGLEQVEINTKEDERDVSTGSFVLSISRSESLIVKIDIEKTSFNVLPETETLYGSFPFHYPVRICTLPSSFAGKMDAVIHRQWGEKRVKWRDWYDFLWYMRKGTELNIYWLEERLKVKGSIDTGQKLTPELLGEIYEKRASSLDVREILKDVSKFMTDSLEKSSTTSWNTMMFVQQKDKLVDAAKRYITSHRS